jgi:amidase
MHPLPEAQDIVAAAAEIGATIGPAEAELYRPHLIELLRMVDDFMQSRTVETPPPMLSPARAPGYRPSAEEDPLRAWLWKSDIGGAETGLLAGKSVSFKDHISVAGIPQTFASVVLDGFVPAIDATIVTRVLEAGGRVVGKHAMNGFANDFPQPLNPHDPTRSPGGSSSGSGVAVAAGEVDISFGGDQGGSIRIPAAHCGIVGMKPTFGLVSHFGATFGAEMTVDHVGPMARRVEDVAAALQAVAGYDDLDPRQRREVPDGLDVLSTLDGGVAGLRIGILEEGFVDPIDTGIGDAVLEAVRVLEGLGAEVSKVSVPEILTTDALYQTLSIEGSRALFDAGAFGVGQDTYYPLTSIAAVSRLWHEHTDVLPARTKLAHIAATFVRATYHGAAYGKAQNAKAGLVAALDGALSDFDLLVLPTCRELPPPVAPKPTDTAELIEADLRRNWIVMTMAANTKPTNLTGHPSLAVPCGKVGHLPTSMQLVGRRFDDALVLRAAYAFQQAVDWDAYTSIG